MYKVHHEYNNTDIYFPECSSFDLLHVRSTGHSHLPVGYRSNMLYRECYVLHYVVSGKGTYHEQDVVGPCLFLETPDYVHHYAVDENPDAPQWEQYWILFYGKNAKQWLELAGFPNKPVVLPCPYINQVINIFQKLQSVFHYSNKNDQLYATSMLFQLLSLHSQNDTPTKKPYSVNIQIVCNYIHENYPSITHEEELANLVHLSTRYLHKVFKKEVGVTPLRYLTDYRIKCAKALLTESDLSISDIAKQTGFSTPNYFSYVFQKSCDGMPPLTYRKTH